MAYGAKTYTLREEFTESGTRYFISFKDGQGESHELEVSEQLFFEFRQMERRNRNLQQWNQRHREFNEVWDETLYRRALRVPKTLDERMIEKKEMKCSIRRLPEIQRPRFLLYYEFLDTYKMIGQDKVSKTYSFPKSYVNYHKPRAVSTKQRERARQMMIAKNRAKGI